MKLKNMILLTGMLLPVSTVFAQYAEDALRFSQTEQGATSRFKAMGGAQTALGGDASSFASNPAGLGLFTKSEFSFTPDLSNASLNGRYLNTDTRAQKDQGGVNQFALLIHNPVRRASGSDLSSNWVSFNFGIAYNKTNNFHTTTDFGGMNPTSSFGDYLTDLASDPDDILATAGYDSHLIELDQASQTYFPLTDVNNTQRNSNFRSGNQSELNFSIGGNYGNSLYIGASIGLASINYNAMRKFVESGITLDQATVTNSGLAVYNETRPYLDAQYRLTYQSDQATRGSGVNAKLGLIYRPDKSFRLGMSIITPTWYTINDTFSEGLATRFVKSNGQTENIPADDEFYETTYQLRTPLRVNGGAALILNTFGLISADVEYVDYTSMHFSMNDGESLGSTNADIQELYQSAVNFRVGAEIKLNPIMLRAGFNRTGNPYQDRSVTSNTVSAGLGYRFNKLSFDLTYASRSTNYTSTPYTISPDYRYFSSTGSGEQANIDEQRTNVFATIGFRF